MKSRTILEAGDLKGKRVLVRVDWSVPMQNDKVINDYQIKQSLPTIKHLQDAGAEIIILSHGEKDTDTLKPIYKYVKELLPELTFKTKSKLVLLENVRKSVGEKKNSEALAKKWAGMADIFVNEAFSVSHREHASIVGIPKFLPSFIGLEFTKEIEVLSKAFFPKRPFLFILGGAKFDTKLPLLKKFLDIADHIFVGGALANNFFKEQGKDVGRSLVCEGDFGLKAMLDTGKIILPEDTITADNRILDVGPRSIESLKSVISESKMVLWNGPMGLYEQGYKTATLDLAKLIAEYGSESIVGGGDTLSAITELGITDKFSFVSTGGGAMLDFLSSGTLPGLEAINSPHPTLS